MSKPPKKAKHQAPAAPLLTGPTILTLARMIIAIFCVILVTIPQTATHIAALVLFIIGAITDHIDGKWARKYAKVTDLGAFLDPLADKILINLAFLALVTMGIIPLWVFAIILIRDFAVDGMRMMVARTGVTVSASFYGKIKTTLQLTALIIILFNLVLNWVWLGIIGNIVLYAALVLTVFSGADYLWQGYQTLTKTQK